MSEALTPEDFAAQLSEPTQAEQPVEDSTPAEAVAVEEGPPDAPADAEQAEGEQTDQPETESDRVIKWQTASGEEIQATESELKAGYLRQQDYTQKTQAVAEERKQVQAKLAEQVSTVQTLAMEIGEFQIAQQTLQQFAQVNWDALEQHDPALAARTFRQFQSAKEAFQNAQSKVQGASHRLAEQRNAEFLNGVAAAEKRLTENVKDVKRDEVLRMFEGLGKAGADQRVIDIVRSTPALAEMAIYAQRWQELQSKKPQVANVVKALPPVTTKARPAEVKTPGERVAKALASKSTFGAAEFASLLKSTR